MAIRKWTDKELDEYIKDREVFDKGMKALGLRNYGLEVALLLREARRNKS